jgi:hypothetical protein
VTIDWIRNGAIQGFYSLVVKRTVTLGKTNSKFLHSAVYSHGYSSGWYKNTKVIVTSKPFCVADTGGCGTAPQETRTIDYLHPTAPRHDSVFTSTLNGYDVAEDYRTDLNFTVVWTASASLREFAADASYLIRCDNMHYFPNYPPGCHVVAEEPTLYLNYNGTGNENNRLEYKQAARFYAYIQDYVYPWGMTGNTWFWRTSEELQARNRAAVCGGRRLSMSCDEFPFAGVHQGCYTSHRAYSCNWRNVDADHNSYAGSLLGAFMTKNRLLRGRKDEQFYFKITGG